MEELKGLFSGRVEIISLNEENRFPDSELGESRENDILDLISRRPCTADDVAAGLGIHPTEAVKHLRSLSLKNKVVLESTGGRNYYRLAADAGNAAASEKDGE